MRQLTQSRIKELTQGLRPDTINVKSAQAENNIHTYIDQMDVNDVKQAGFDYLVELLHHIGVKTAARALRVSTRTLRRVIDPDRSIEDISYVTAAYIVLMFETNISISRTMDTNPRVTAYFKKGIKK